MRHVFAFASCLLFVAACGEPAADPVDAGPPDAGGPTGLAVLGGGVHTPDAVDVSVVANVDDGLVFPRDVAVNPEDPSQVWLVNLASTTVVITGYGTATQEAATYSGFGRLHFMARPSALAFGAPGTMATAQEEDEETQPTTPYDFMGPSLWTTDLAIFDAGHSGHIDMLHNSPNGAGIAWETGNVYWVFDGWHQSLTRYDFNMDHGPGGADHSDGIVARYVEGEVGYVDDVPSDLEMDRETGLLYVADTGNARIAVLDTSTGTRGAPISPNYDGTEQYAMDGASLTTFVEGGEPALQRPSGLALHEGHVYVTDNATSRVLAYDMDGELVDWLDLATEVAPSGLMGIDFDADGALLAVDSEGEQLLRVAPLAE
jgi:DNA-binding beta-propeller fold protein YncE